MKQSATEDKHVQEPPPARSIHSVAVKILFLTHRFHPEIGGIEINAEIYARAFAAAGCQVRLLTWSAATDEATFPFAVIRKPSKWRLFREHAWADVVFENNPCVRLAWPGLFFGRPSVISLNTDLHLADGIGWIKHQWLKRANSIISVSEALRNKCWPAAEVIGNPYRASEFKLLPNVARTRNFVFLGRLVSQKGAAQAVLAFHQILIRLLDEGNGELPGLTIIGDGPERQNLEQLVASLDLSAHVRFAGFLHGRELAHQLNQHRLLLVPSLYGEAFGNVVLEGMACGCIPIVSDSDGLPDAVGKAGLVFSRGSVEAQTESIWRLLHDPGLEARLRQAAPAHLAAHKPEVVSGRYLQMLQAALNRRRE